MHNIAPMTEDQEAIRDAVSAVCSQFDAEYWRRTDETGDWPEAFNNAMAEGGWLGIAMPEEVGGSGLGLMEAAIMMQTVARSGAGFTGCSSIHLNIFGAKPIEKFGTSEQKQEFLPKIISGQQKMCFGVTEPACRLAPSAPIPAT
jgi:acyl-CoA dehydrogenase